MNDAPESLSEDQPFAIYSLTSSGETRIGGADTADHAVQLAAGIVAASSAPLVVRGLDSTLIAKVEIIRE
jgi:hypothetical protein